MLSYILILITVLMFGCQSTQTDKDVSSMQRNIDPQSVEEISTPVSASELANPETEKPLSFCNDDIYSEHIRRDYLRKSPAQSGQSALDFRLKAQLAQQEAFQTLRYQLPLEFAGLPVEASPRVLSWIQHFTGNGRSDFLLWLVRSESYRNVVVPLLKEQGLPPEFFFLAMIESGFSNIAFSRSRAAGTWQFMKPTAEHYGLQIDNWVDERRDPVKSTLAAARYLKDLNRQFGNWYLALAAYNAGPGRILNAMKEMKSRDYWALGRSSKLRPETKNYVPKLLAAMIIASHPANFGFDIAPDLRNERPTTQVKILSTYRIADIAAKLNLTVTDIKRWNPELVHSVTPPINEPHRPFYVLRMPKALSEQFEQEESELERLEVEDILLHKIKKGETLASIARKYKITINKILMSNPRLEPKRLRPGETLAVPTPNIVGQKHAASL